jgi:dTMP kinase
MRIVPNFVVFEGGDGSGTTTQIEALRRNFSVAAIPLWTTCEPSGGQVGALVRSALRSGIVLEDETLAYLFAADRHEHLYMKDGVVERALRGELVVSDRYVPSSLVYQGIRCGDALPRRLNEGFPLPELLLFFDIDPALALKRMEKRPVREIYEYLDFQVEVRERYLRLLPEFRAQGVRTAIIDAAEPVEIVTRAVWSELEKLPILETL